MPFVPGYKRAENAGIKKGQKHLKTVQWEEFGKNLLDAGLPRALQIMKECDDVMFMDNFHKLLEYFKPKLARVELDADVNVKTVSETTIFQIKPKG